MGGATGADEEHFAKSATTDYRQLFKIVATHAAASIVVGVRRGARVLRGIWKGMRGGGLTRGMREREGYRGDLGGE